MLSTIIKLSSLRKHTELFDELTLEQARNIATEASKQGVAGWILERLKTDYQSEQGYEILKNELLKQTLLVHLKNQENISIINEIYRLLNAENIEVVLLKGGAMMTSYYSQPSLRPIGDIDLWIDKNDIYRARDILIAAGAVSTNTDQPAVIDMEHAHLAALIFRGQIVELHHRLYNIAFDMELPNAISSYIEQRGNYLVLNEKAMFFHLLTHAGLDTMRRGLRVGWIVDILFMLTQSKNPKELISFVRQSNPNAEIHLKKVIGMAMTMMNDDMQSQYIMIGFNPIEFDPLGKLKKISSLHLKYILLSAKIHDFYIRIHNKHGLRAKLLEIKTIFTYETNRTREYYRNNCLFVAWIRRIFGKGIVKRDL